MAVIQVDTHGVVRDWNVAASEMLGYTSDEILEKPITTIIPTHLQKKHELKFQEFVRRDGKEGKSQCSHFVTCNAVDKSGNLVPVHMTIRFILGSKEDKRVVAVLERLKDTASVNLLSKKDASSPHTNSSPN
jgi:PAS domain S-box-containing protein